MSRMVDSTGPVAEEAKIVDSNPRDTLRSDPVAHASLVVAVRYAVCRAEVLVGLERGDVFEMVGEERCVKRVVHRSVSCL